jgi:signal transduction histidine kinase
MKLPQILLLLLPAAAAGQELKVIELARLDAPPAYDTAAGWMQVFSSDTKIGYDSAWRYFQAGKAQSWHAFQSPLRVNWYQYLPDFIEANRRYYWTVFVVENCASEPYPLLLTGPALDSSQVQQMHGREQQRHVIARRATEDGNGLLQRALRNEIVVRIPPGRRDTLLLRMRGVNLPPDFRPKLFNAFLYESQELARRWPVLLLGIGGAGLMLGILLYCLLNYARTRSPMLLWYALFCATIIVMTLRTVEHRFLYIAFTARWASWFETKLLLQGLATMSYYQFILRFLGGRPPYLRTVARAIAWITLAAIALDLLLMAADRLAPASYLLYYGYRVATFLLGLSLLLPFWFSADSLSRLALIGSGSLLLGEALSILFPSHVISDIASTGTVMADTIFFTAAIAYRNRQQARDNQRLQMEVAHERIRNAEQALQAQTQRIKILRSLHDHVQNLVMRIILQARQSPKNAQAPAAALAEIGKTAQELNEQLRRIITEGPDSPGPEAAPLPQASEQRPPRSFADLQRSCQEQAAQCFRTIGIALHTDLPPGPEGLVLPHEAFEHFQGILSECMTNILKHSGATEVRLSLRCLPGPKLHMEVSDNGRGLPPDLPVDTQGFRSVRERVQELGGSLELVSEPGQGLRVGVGVRM